jgi:DNA transformation protein and related proteins
MAVSREFRDFVKDILTGFEPVQIKPMFGGAGISAEGVNFGLIAEDAVYLKVDEKNRAAFESEGMSPFIYKRKGKPIPTSYWRIPDRLLENPDELIGWARASLAAAKRAKKR